MDTEVLIYVDLEGEPTQVGRLWARRRKGRDSAAFEYDDGWLERHDRFALEPALQLGPGPFYNLKWWRRRSSNTRYAAAPRDVAQCR